MGRFEINKGVETIGKELCLRIRVFEIFGFESVKDRRRREIVTDVYLYNNPTNIFLILLIACFKDLEAFSDFSRLIGSGDFPRTQGSRNSKPDRHVSPIVLSAARVTGGNCVSREISKNRRKRRFRGISNRISEISNFANSP